jgi:predicted amidohydrolase
MLIASAQTQPTRFNISANLSEHYRMIEKAAEQGVRLIAFPELSITGYERVAAKELAFTPTDERLNQLRDLSVQHNLVVIAGVPIQIEDQLYIGSFILKPDRSISIYTKQYLHPGEEEYFDPSFSYNPLIELDNERISLAICADIDHPEHAQDACQRGATLYIPSIFFSPRGIPEAYKSLGYYAKQHSMNILMANFCGHAWENESGGRSAFWNKNGELIGELDDQHPGLLVVEKIENKWNLQIIPA